MPDFDLEDILPLLQSRQRQQEAERASGAMGSIAGKTLAPNLYDYLTQPRPPTPGPFKQPLEGASGPPSPVTAGKIPPQDPMDPRIPAALRDIGVMGAGGVLGRAAAPLVEGGAALAGRIGSRMTAPSEGLKSIAGAAAMNPADQAQAAKLSYEQRQQLEFERQKAAASASAEQARIQGQAEAQAKAESIKAEAQRQQEEQARVATALRAKKDREAPFREKFPGTTAVLPWAAAAGSVAGPAVSNYLNRGTLRNFVRDWEGAGDAASKAMLGRSKNVASLGVNKLNEYEKAWPQMQKTYDTGTSAASKLGWGFLPAEGSLVPTEWDAATQQPNSPSYPKAEDWKDSLARAGAVWGGGTGMAGIGGKLKGAPVAPYTGGPGIVRSYEQKYPVRAKQKQIADTLRLGKQ